MSTFFRYVCVIVVFILVAIGFSVYYPSWFAHRADDDAFDVTGVPALSEESVSQDYSGVIETLRVQ